MAGASRPARGARSASGGSDDRQGDHRTAVSVRRCHRRRGGAARPDDRRGAGHPALHAVCTAQADGIGRSQRRVARLGGTLRSAAAASPQRGDHGSQARSRRAQARPARRGSARRARQGVRPPCAAWRGPWGSICTTCRPAARRTRADRRPGRLRAHLEGASVRQEIQSRQRHGSRYAGRTHQAAGRAPRDCRAHGGLEEDDSRTTATSTNAT